MLRNRFFQWDVALPLFPNTHNMAKTTWEMSGEMGEKTGALSSSSTPLPSSRLPCLSWHCSYNSKGQLAAATCTRSVTGESKKEKAGREQKQQNWTSVNNYSNKWNVWNETWGGGCTPFCQTAPLPLFFVWFLSKSKQAFPLCYYYTHMHKHKVTHTHTPCMGEAPWLAQASSSQCNIWDSC